MTTTRLLHSISGNIILIALAGLSGSSCEQKRGRYDNAEPAGTAEIKMIIDADTVEADVTDNVFFMELMTREKTFVVRPTSQELYLPKLPDTLVAVNVFYKEWATTVTDDVLSKTQELFYYPGDSATIVIDTYPFTEERAKNWRELNKDRVYLEIRKYLGSGDNGVFQTYMEKYQPGPTEK